jgi:Flp pilus assembly protein TadG
MTSPIKRACRFIIAVRDDASGIILPYVAMLLTVLVGMSALAIDMGRQMSLQTQMQAVADALALAGARELNQQAGAQARATSAINALVSNGLTGLGSNPAIAHSVAFYSALPAAATAFAGTAATSDVNTKYVAVTLSTTTITHTFFPSNLSAGAQAIAGFTSQTFCDIPPVFICNPYETAGMSDSDATAALRTALADDATKQKLLRMDMTQTSPGHFGWLIPPDGCTGTSCLKDWIAKTHPNTCFQTSSVDMNTGLKTNVSDALNVRFDIYNGSLNYSTDYAPSVNVRKGLLPSKSGGKNPWCSADVPSKAVPNAPYYTLPIVTGLTGTTAKGNNIISAITPGTTGLILGNPMLANPLNGLSNTATMSAIDPVAKTVTVTGGNANKSGTGVALTSEGITSGFPLDSNMTDTTVIFGNGDWNCADYWAVNHTAAAPAGCTKANPTISRYQIYRYEIAQNLVNDWSAGPDGSRPDNTAGNKNSENGAPLCAGAGTGVDTSTGGPDRRVIPAAVINCLAQSNLIGGGANANNIPVAGFGKFFMTQPVGLGDPQVNPTSIYGEMSGLIGISDDVKILNQVQLYR